MTSEEYIEEHKTIEASQAFDICKEHGCRLIDYYKYNLMESKTEFVCTKSLLCWLGY
jgi:hypothetical protein